MIHTPASACLSRIVVFGTAIAASLCVASCDTSEDDGNRRASDHCYSQVLCVSDSDCPAGEHCNSAVGTPSCMALYCGAFGALCDEDGLCISGYVCRDDNTCGPPTGLVDSGTGDAATDTGTADDATDDTTDDGEGSSDVATDSGTDTSPPAPFRYVMIEDLETTPTSTEGTAGVDIYGVELENDSSTVGASSFADCQFGAQSNADANDCNQALGGAGASCNPDAPDFVSLGGDGGHIVVSFPRDLDAGDTIRVYECGTTANPRAVSEYYRVLVGPNSDPSSSDWVVCLERGTDLSTCTVPAGP